MIKAYVYYHGPLTAFTGQPHAVETVAIFVSRWRWLAQARAVAACKHLNMNRCGLRVEDALGNVLEDVPATVQELGSL